MFDSYGKRNRQTRYKCRIIKLKPQTSTLFFVQLFSANSLSMGNSVSQYGDAFTNNDYLLRFAGELRIEPTDPFWDQFLTFMMKLPASM
jgi:hypothetical protein